MLSCFVETGKIPWSALYAAYEVLQVLPIGASGGDVFDLGFDRLRRLVWSRENISGTPLLQLLFMHRGAGATDPRDHVYALLGLAEDGEEFEVDYTKSVAQVFCDTARRILSSSQQLMLLNLLGNVRSSSDPTLPSWVPDWRSDMQFLPLVEFAHNPVQIQPEFSRDGLKLTLVGIEVDTDRKSVV